MLLDHLFSNNDGFGSGGNNESETHSGLGNDSNSFNPFEAIVGTNSTDFGQLMENS
jgi:hypothetical protein